MGPRCNRRTFDEHVVRRIRKVLLAQGEPESESKEVVTRIQEVMWERYDASAMTIAEIRRLVGLKRFERQIAELLNQEKTFFLDCVAGHVLHLLTRMDIEADPDLVAFLQEEMWGLVGRRVKRGMSKKKVLRLADKACTKYLDVDLVLEVRDRYHEQLVAGTEDDADDLADEIGFDQLTGPTASELRQLERQPAMVVEVTVDEDTLPEPIGVHVHSGDCRCGTRVLSEVIANEDGGDEVVLARAGAGGRPATLSYTRLSDQDVLGVNASLVS